MHIITCASSKGGVGKSTTCVCLAGAFAKAGDTVHIIDLDSNGTVSRWLADDSLRPRAITVSSPAPADLNQHLKKLNAPNGPDRVFIDVAGAYEKTLAYAIANMEIEHEIGKIDEENYKAAFTLLQEALRRAASEKTDYELTKSKVSSVLLGETPDPTQKTKTYAVTKCKND